MSSRGIRSERRRQKAPKSSRTVRTGRPARHRSSSTGGAPERPEPVSRPRQKKVPMPAPRGRCPGVCGSVPDWAGIGESEGLEPFGQSRVRTRPSQDVVPSSAIQGGGMVATPPRDPSMLASTAARHLRDDPADPPWKAPHDPVPDVPPRRRVRPASPRPPGRAAPAPRPSPTPCGTSARRCRGGRGRPARPTARCRFPPR